MQITADISPCAYKRVFYRMNLAGEEKRQDFDFLREGNRRINKQNAIATEIKFMRSIKRMYK